MKRTTRDMSDRHEEYLAELFGGIRSKNSGAHFANQMDGRHAHGTRWPLAWDGKSTLGASIGVTRTMWDKAVEQSHDANPMLALRWYDGQILTPALDLVVVEANFFAEVHHEAQGGN